MANKKSKTTLKALVEQGRQAGLHIETRIRKDGGLIITDINGHKFSGKSGNAALRSRMGVQLTSAQTQQRKSANITNISKAKERRGFLTDEEIRLINRINRAIRKRNKDEGKEVEKPLTAQSWLRKAKGYYKALNAQERIGVLKNKLEYSQGRAHAGSKDYIAEIFTQFNNDLFKKGISRLRRNNSVVSEALIDSIIDILYQYQNGTLTAEEFTEEAYEKWIEAFPKDATR